MTMIAEKDVLHRIEEGSAVYYDAANGVAGQTYPIGTGQMPVDNITDLLAILIQRGLHKVILLSDITLTAGMQGYKFIGLRRVTQLVNLNGQEVGGSYFENLRITGAVNWADSYGPIFKECDLDSVTAFSAMAYLCRVPNGDTLTIGAGHSSYIHDMHFDDATVNANGCNRLDIWNGHGKIELAGATGGAINILMNGDLTLAASCTGGTINLYGDFHLTNNSAGSTVNDYRKLKETAPTQGTATQNWQAAEADIVQVGADNTLNEIGAIEVSMRNMAGNVILRMYKQINGVEDMCRYGVWAAGSPDVGVVLVNSNWKVNEVVRVTAESDNAADNGQAIDYEYIITPL